MAKHNGRPRRRRRYWRKKNSQFAMSSSRSNLANPFGGTANPFGSGGTLCYCSLVAQYADHTHRRGIVQRKNFWLIQLKYAQSFGLIRSWKKIKISHKKSARGGNMKTKLRRFQERHGLVFKESTNYISPSFWQLKCQRIRLSNIFNL